MRRNLRFNKNQSVCFILYLPFYFCLALQGQLTIRSVTLYFDHARICLDDSIHLVRFQRRHYRR